HGTCSFFKAFGLAGCETHPIQQETNPAGDNPAGNNPARVNPATARRSYWIAGVSPAEHGTCSFFKAFGLVGCETHPIQQEATQQEATQRETNPAGNNPAGGNPATAQFQQELSSATIIRNGKPMNHIEETDESHRKNR
ncbi:MAG: hypothetical protein LHW51_02495, partial [Candidatus Cloacimonetes bacterium]|nr:hypothetical protein [Candidatus Cloacimonadota bacterium]MCK9243632.1 hypothetical protein [Candidatus Cloacimonadota bacterium]